MEVLYSAADFTADFSVFWHDGECRERTARGYYLTCTSGGVVPDGRLLFRRNLGRSAAKDLTKYLCMENALAEIGAGGALWCIEEDPARLTDAESRSLCAGFMDALHQNDLPFPPARGIFPLRERQFMCRRGRLLRPHWNRTERGGAENDCTGQGLLFLAECVMRRVFDRGMWGLTLCISGQTAAAEQARKQAACMGCSVSGQDNSDVILLFDICGLTALPANRPVAVFEAPGVRTLSCIAEEMVSAGICFCPSLVCSAGMAAYHAENPSDDPWQEQRRLRQTMEDVCGRVMAEELDLYHGAYCAALRRMEKI